MTDKDLISGKQARLQMWFGKKTKTEIFEVEINSYECAAFILFFQKSATP